mmetsp:Transcript_33702/g.62021  ORF Transcript_33702/g.62021 Transcript_33702/m.62021 type:complete len:263 (+) Transcript_33702:312-1100(+)
MVPHGSAPAVTMSAFVNSAWPASQAKCKGVMYSPLGPKTSTSTCSSSNCKRTETSPLAAASHNFAIMSFCFAGSILFHVFFLALAFCCPSLFLFSSSSIALCAASAACRLASSSAFFFCAAAFFFASSFFLAAVFLTIAFFGIGHWFLVMFFLLLLALLVRNYFNNICLHHSSLDSLSSCLVICLAYQRSLFGLFRRQCCRCVKLHHPRPRMNIHLCGLDHAFAPCLRCRDICSSCTWHHALVVLELRWLGRLLRCLLVARL